MCKTCTRKKVAAYQAAHRTAVLTKKRRYEASRRQEHVEAARWLSATGTKRCTSCGAEKPVTEFYKHLGSSTGLQGACIACYKQRVTAYNQEHASAKRAYWQSYHQKNKARRQHQKQQRRLADPEKERQRRQAEHVRLREANVRRARRWRAAHPGATTRQVQAWAAQHPEAYKALKAREAAKRRGSERVTWAAEDLRELMAQQQGQCFYCHTVLGESYHIEHKLPLSRGGQHEPGNICLACPQCNMRKHDKTPEEFLIILMQEEGQTHG